MKSNQLLVLVHRGASFVSCQQKLLCCIHAVVGRVGENFESEATHHVHSMPSVRELKLFLEVENGNNVLDNQMRVITVGLLAIARNVNVCERYLRTRITKRTKHLC